MEENRIKNGKRNRLEIIYDILNIIQNSPKPIKITPLLRKTNISSSRFKKYFTDLLNKGFVKKINVKEREGITLTDKGSRFLEKYQTITNFIEEFEL